VVVVDYDETKLVEELEFVFIPIWIRVTKLPLGMMNRLVGEAIGEEVGEFLDMEKEDDGTTVRKFLRIKVRIDIRKPLMRGVTLNVGDNEKALWCPLIYEYLPDFSYICALIGHVDKVCHTKLQKGEMPQYRKHLRFIPDRRRMEESVGEKFKGARNSSDWRSGNGGSRSSGGRFLTSGGGSDAQSWRKTQVTGKDVIAGKSGDEDEVTSPVKIREENSTGDLAK